MVRQTRSNLIMSRAGLRSENVRVCLVYLKNTTSTNNFQRDFSYASNLVTFRKVLYWYICYAERGKYCSPKTGILNTIHLICNKGIRDEMKLHP